MPPSMIRPPLILWRFLAADLLKVVLLTAAVLVAFIAFVAAFRPMADGRLSPGQALTFMALAVVPMLQFALPFAAGFGATLAYHRFAADNEASAAMTSGMSHRSLLAPAAITGLGLALVLGSLNLEIIPRFLRAMQTMLGADLALAIVSNVESGRAVRLPDGVLVHAKTIRQRPPEPGSKASSHFIMEGVLAMKANSAAGVDGWVAAQRAGVWMFDDKAAPPTGLVVIRLIDAESSGAFEGGAEKIDLRFAPPSPFRDSTKFYPTRDLLRLADQPERIPNVETRRRALADALDAARLEREARDSLAASGRIVLADPEGQTVSIRGAGLQPDGDRWRIAPGQPNKPIELSWRLAGDRLRLQTAERAFLRAVAPSAPGEGAFGPALGATADAGAGVTLLLELENVATQDAASEAAGAAVLPARRFPGLSIAGGPPPSAPAATRELLAAAASAEDGSPVADAAARLRGSLLWLSREVLSRHHERAAMAVSCLVMVLSGAVGGLRLSQSRPLLVYAWSFAPSLLAILTIYSGQEIFANSVATGVLVTWSGLAALAAFVFVDYRRMSRH